MRSGNRRRGLASSIGTGRIKKRKKLAFADFKVYSSNEVKIKEEVCLSIVFVTEENCK